MSGGSKETTTTSNTVDPKLMALYQQNYATAQNVANRPYQPYTGQLVAPFSGAQTQAQQAGTDIFNSNVGADTLNQGILGTQSVAGYQPDQISAGLLANTDLTPYLNPYTQDVVDRTLGTLDTARQQAMNEDAAKATAAGAFGGSRSGVLQALTSNDYAKQAADTVANLNYQGFSNAQQAAMADLNRQLTAAQANQGAGLQGANLHLNADSQLAALSQDQLNQAAQRMGILGAVGDQQQQQQQSVDDALYQQFLNAWNYPVQQQDIRNAALGMIPMQQTQTQTSKTSGGGIGSIFDGILGLGQTAGALGWAPLVGL